MTIRIPIAAAVAVMLMASPGLAADNQTKTPENLAEKKICRMETGTGTILRKRVCRTQAEMDAMAARSQADMDRRQNASSNRGSM